MQCFTCVVTTTTIHILWRNDMINISISIVLIEKFVLYDALNNHYLNQGLDGQRILSSIITYNIYHQIIIISQGKFTSFKYTRKI